MPSFLELSIPSLIAGLAYIAASKTDHTLAIIVAMCAALGGFFMLYFFSIMEKFPIVVSAPSEMSHPEKPQAPQPTLEELFGPEEVQQLPLPQEQLPQEVSADTIPHHQQQTLPRKRTTVIREYFEEPITKRPRSARELEQKIQAQMDKATQARSKHPTRRTPMERCRLAILPLLQNLLVELQADPAKEHDINRQVEDLLI